MITIQVVGYKNSGKTTLVSELIKAFSEKGLKVGSLKHHGHGGSPLPPENTDSTIHEKAGATMTGVEGAGTFQLTMKQSAWDLDQLMSFYRLMPIDLLLIEGFKKEPLQKIVLIRQEEDLPLLEELKNIKVVVTDLALNYERYHYPIFRRHETKQLIGWLLENVIVS
ncbi:molybdopterin-guanine dinucleotide biosynthesis protein B [Salirhabdus euzebyi]|uniref:Molybdopterin-guanine dinucleotide biosynthesis protein B n=1 Tax=Salirhabdus euzebyi TaxID=394506 RepID=A0A841Q6R5_9BACI|nr:molybdopterin-guanine dinucleotide biosynthesis protein B [Salirhabdus euzebyi]MBB6454044.1 molybdopterin-guanine dinucleotide biosynthesis protein B [Salirhabdus euzebyi]